MQESLSTLPLYFAVRLHCTAHLRLHCRARAAAVRRSTAVRCAAARGAPAFSIDRMISSRRGKVRKISEEGNGECRKTPHLHTRPGAGQM